MGIDLAACCQQNRCARKALGREGIFVKVKNLVGQRPILILGRKRIKGATTRLQKLIVETAQRILVLRTGTSQGG